MPRAYGASCAEVQGQPQWSGHKEWPEPQLAATTCCFWNFPHIQVKNEGFYFEINETRFYFFPPSCGLENQPHSFIILLHYTGNI